VTRARGDADFAEVRWNRRVEIQVTTLDALAAQYGAPAFVNSTSKGASRPRSTDSAVPCRRWRSNICPRRSDSVGACVDRLGALDHYVYNWSPGESYRFASGEWLEGPALLDALRGSDAQQRSGDVYARLKR